MQLVARHLTPGKPKFNTKAEALEALLKHPIELYLNGTTLALRKNTKMYGLSVNKEISNPIIINKEDKSEMTDKASLETDINSGSKKIQELDDEFKEYERRRKQSLEQISKIDRHLEKLKNNFKFLKTFPHVFDGL